MPNERFMQHHYGASGYVDHKTVTLPDAVSVEMLKNEVAVLTSRLERAEREAAGHLNQPVIDLPDRSPLRIELARVRQERDAWEHTAAEFARNMEYYRGLVDECALHIGPAAYVCDDGSISESPLRAKVPELIATMSRKLLGVSLKDDSGPSPLCAQLNMK
jgi:hypothetical protein